MSEPMAYVLAALIFAFVLSASELHSVDEQLQQCQTGSGAYSAPATNQDSAEGR